MVSVRPVTLATPLAVTCTRTLWPSGTGKLGVTVISTAGGTGVAEATRITGALADTTPSVAVIRTS